MISLRNKIFKYMLLSTTLVTLVFVSITVILFYIQESAESRNDLMRNAVSYSNLSLEDIEKNLEEFERITIINSDGDVEFDSKFFEESKNLNHKNRPEVREAFRSGRGESIRFSDTTNEPTYYAAVLRDDGTVIRVSTSTEHIFHVVIRNPMIFIMMLLLDFLLCFFFSVILTRALLIPIEDSNAPKQYEELKIYKDLINLEKSKVLEQEKQIVNKDITLQTIKNSNLREGFVIINDETDDVVMNDTAENILKSSNITPAELDRMFQTNKQAEYLIELNDLKYSVYVNPLIMNEEDVGKIYFMVDVTENLNIEALRRNFTANVSHELKTPLSTILGYSELIENNMVSEEARIDFTRKIREEVTQLVTLVEDILMLSNLDEASEHSFTQCSTKQIIDRVLNSLEQKAKNKNITILCDVDDFAYSLNYRLFYEIVHNLVLNSINYSKESSEVNIICKKIDGKLNLKVMDSGIGIPKSEHERIFERFYRVEKSRSRRTEGTGLGLSIVKNAVKHHKGEIYVTSELGEGTTFTVII